MKNGRPDEERLIASIEPPVRACGACGGGAALRVVSRRRASVIACHEQNARGDDE
jgi:hypothetical protein